jgi:hypothetical protein
MSPAQHIAVRRAILSHSAALSVADDREGRGMPSGRRKEGIVVGSIFDCDCGWCIADALLASFCSPLASSMLEVTAAMMAGEGRKDESCSPTSFLSLESKTPDPPPCNNLSSEQYMMKSVNVHILLTY